jgi:hypothetical protein
MSYKVCIVELATGETRIHDMGDIPWGEASVFWWTEGNFGCDCNREWEFARAGGMPESEVMKIHGACGHKRFFVPWAEVDGKRVPIDASEAAA